MVGYMMTPSSFLVIKMKIIGIVLTCNTYLQQILYENPRKQSLNMGFKTCCSFSY